MRRCGLVAEPAGELRIGDHVQRADYGLRVIEQHLVTVQPHDHAGRHVQFIRRREACGALGVVQLPPRAAIDRLDRDIRSRRAQPAPDAARVAADRHRAEDDDQGGRDHRRFSAKERPAEHREEPDDDNGGQSDEPHENRCSKGRARYNNPASSAFNTARVRSRAPSFDRMLDT